MGKQGPSGDKQGMSSVDSGEASSSVEDAARTGVGTSWLAPSTWNTRTMTIVVVLLCALLYVPMAGSYGLWDPWETHYGQVSREILQRSDPISPFREDKWFWSKPIMTFWLESAGMRLLGLNRLGSPASELALSSRTEWGMRLPIILMSLIGLWALFAVVRRLFSRRAALLSVLVCATSPMYALITRQAITDIPLVGPLTAALALLMLAIFSDRKERPKEMPSVRPWMLMPAVLVMMLAVWPGQDGRSLFYVEPWFGLAELVVGIAAMVAVMRLGPTGTARCVPWLYWAMLGGQLLLGVAGFVFSGPPTGVWTVLMTGALAFGTWELYTGKKVAVTAWHLFGLALALVTWAQYFLFGNLIGPRFEYVVGPIAGLRINLFGWPYMLPWIALWGYYVASTVLSKDRSSRRLYLHLAWMLAGIAVLAKGLGGLFFPMAVVGVFILVTRRWRLFGDLELGRGLALWFAVAAPWHHAMWIRHGNGFWSEYIIHHHFKRLELGVHGQRGSLEYFVHQLGFGMFPWSALIPPALLRLILGPTDRDRRGQIKTFLVVWAGLIFTLFAMMETKFHHYILPAIPPLAILVGVWLDEALDRKDAGVVLAGLFAIGFVLLLGRDLYRDPQHLVVMFIYKYDRLFPYELNFEPGIVMVTALAVAAMAAFTIPKLRRYSAWAFAVAGVVVALWTIDDYLVRLSPHWSQKQLHATYYKYRKGPDERLIAWELNWHGENFYSKNRVVIHMEPKKVKEFQAYLRRYEGWTFYIILEQGRYNTLKRTLPTERARQTLRIIGPDGKPWPDVWVKHFRDKRFSVLKKPYMNNKFLLVKTTI